MTEKVVSKEYGNLVYWIDAEDENRVGLHHWFINNEKRILTSIDGKLVSLPQFLLNYSGKLYIDHINNDVLDNRKSNLRQATPKQNSQNRLKSKTYALRPTTSQYKGVTFDWISLKWRCQIGIDYKVINLGRYNSEIEAAIKYNLEASKNFQQFARLNELPELIDSSLLIRMTFENANRLLEIVYDERATTVNRLYMDCNPDIFGMNFPTELVLGEVYS
jgi:hypothetical protein